MNNWSGMGRLTRDPELRHTQSNIPVASFTLAVDRAYSKGSDKQVDFIDCTAWRGTAEFVSKYFVKGQMTAVTGRLQMRDWQDRDGNKRISAEIIVDNVFFTGSKKESGGGYQGGETHGNYQSGGDFADLGDDEEELPF